MQVMTIRNALIDNLREKRKPYNVAQLAKVSGVARETIRKMEDGDYGNVRFASIEKVFDTLGYDVCVAIKPKAASRN